MIMDRFGTHIKNLLRISSSVVIPGSARNHIRFYDTRNNGDVSIDASKFIAKRIQNDEMGLRH